MDDWIENWVEYRGVKVNKDALKYDKSTIDEYINTLTLGEETNAIESITYQKCDIFKKKKSDE